MAYDGKLLARARERLERQREENREEQQRRTIRAYALLPEIREIDEKLRAQMPRLALLAFSHEAGCAEEIENLRVENMEL